MKDLPKVFANTINKKIQNSQERTVINEEHTVDIEDLLSKNVYSFNHTYKITLNNDSVIEDSIIQFISNKVLTIENGWIDINSIKSIIEIKK